MNPLTEGRRIALGYDYFAKGFTGPQLSEAYYRLIAERRQERMLFETATMAEIDEIYNSGEEYEENDRLTTDEMITEAVRVRKYSRTDTTMAALVRVLNGHLQDGEIDALVPIIGKPKKSGLFATVTVQIPFSDGQVVSIIFHSPDNNKMKITADDEIIAFRWLLNKRDITQVVSPESDAEVSLQEIGKRLGQLVGKNSARFQATQKDIVAQKKQMEELKAGAEGAATQHADMMHVLQAEVDAAEMAEKKIESLKVQIDKQEAYNEDLQAKIDALKAKRAANDGKAVGGETPKTEAEMKAEQERAAYEEKQAAFNQELAGRGFEKIGLSYTLTSRMIDGIAEKDFFSIKAGMYQSGLDGYDVFVTVNANVKTPEKRYNSKTLAGTDKQAAKALAYIDNKIAELTAVNTKGLEQNLPKGTVAGGVPEIVSLYDAIGNNDVPGNEKQAVRFEVVGKDEAKKLKDATGLELEGYKHTIDSFSIRHIRNTHGDPAAEEKRGQVAVTAEDFARIPEIVKDYDGVELSGKDDGGNDLVKYHKSYNGITYYVEEVRNKRNELMTKTLWKTRTASNVPSEEAPLATSETVQPESPQGVDSLRRGDGKIKSIVTEMLPNGWKETSVFDNVINYGNGKYTAGVTRWTGGESSFRVTISDGTQVIHWKDAKTIEEANAAAVDMMQNAETLNAEYLAATKEEEGGGGSSTEESAAVAILDDIIAGKYGAATKAIDKALDDAAAILEKLGMMEKYDVLLNQAADAFTVILKEKARRVMA